MQKRVSTSHSDGQEQHVIHGIAASPGIAIAKGIVYRKDKPVISSETIDSEKVPEHVRRFENAKEIIEKELNRMRNKEIDSTTLEIIEAQIEMVNDPEVHKQVVNRIKKNNHAVDFAIQQVFEAYLDMMEQSSNEATRERMVDVEDIRDRLIQVANNYSVDYKIEPGSIIVAEDLSPREVIKFADLDIKGIVMERGGKLSHASIIAHSMGIPCIVGGKRASKLIESGNRLIIDGRDGLVIIEPDKQTSGEYRNKLADLEKEKEKEKEILARESATADGNPFTLRANIEFIEELANVEHYRAEGIGLLRTESIYLAKEQFEDFQKQEFFYSKILKETGDKSVTIRLFDAGGDKFFSLGSREKNPFLGWRGIRMLLDERDLLRNQLRAILTVAGRFPGRVNILVPMISSVEEIIAVNNEIASMQSELADEGVAVDEQVKTGIMVEVPSVAVQAQNYAPYVDFFSIGTNDLTQYTLAVDRGNELISDLFQQIHPAVWKLIQIITEVAEKEDIEISVCGEMASYPEAAACLVGMGINDLSMSPASIPGVKSLLTEHSLKEMKELSVSVLNADTVAEVEEILLNWSKS